MLSKIAKLPYEKRIRWFWVIIGICAVILFGLWALLDTRFSNDSFLLKLWQNTKENRKSWPPTEPPGN